MIFIKLTVSSFHQANSYEPNFLHDPDELVLIDLAISVGICRLDHAFNSCIVKVEVALVQHILKLGAIEVASVIVIEVLEYF